MPPLSQRLAAAIQALNDAQARGVSSALPIINESINLLIQNVQELEEKVK